VQLGALTLIAAILSLGATGGIGSITGFDAVSPTRASPTCTDHAAFLPLLLSLRGAADGFPPCPPGIAAPSPACPARTATSRAAVTAATTVTG